MRRLSFEIELLEEMIRKIVREELEETLSESRFGSEFKDEVWNRNEVAKFLNTTVENVTARVKKKEIPAKRIGRQYKFIKSEIISIFKKR